MLKLAYTETDLHIEKLAVSIEEWVSQRTLLALRVGSKVTIEPMNAAFGISTNLEGWNDLEYLICREASESISLSVCDIDTIELSLEGYWLSYSPHSDEGVFITLLPPAVEKSIVEVWEASRQDQPLYERSA